MAVLAYTFYAFMYTFDAFAYIYYAFTYVFYIFTYVFYAFTYIFYTLTYAFYIFTYSYYALTYIYYAFTYTFYAYLRTHLYTSVFGVRTSMQKSLPYAMLLGVFILHILRYCSRYGTVAWLQTHPILLPAEPWRVGDRRSVEEKCSKVLAVWHHELRGVPHHQGVSAAQSSGAPLNRLHSIRPLKFMMPHCQQPRRRLPFCVVVLAHFCFFVFLYMCWFRFTSCG